VRLRDEATRLVKASIPYVYQGRDEHGMDCTGVVLAVYRSVGVDLPDMVKSIQDVTGDGFVLEEAIAAYADLFMHIEEKAADVGDLVLFADNSAHINHIGVIFEPRRICHARRGVGVVNERLAKFSRLYGTKFMRYVGDGCELLK